MTRTGYVEGAAWVAKERQEWNPTVKTILAFVIGLVVLSPAILGIYWELLLPK